MIKKVNIYPTRVIHNIGIPITGVTLNQELSVGDIEKCLIANAKVEEILSNGTTVRLSLLNYTKVMEEKRNEIIKEAKSAFTSVNTETIKVEDDKVEEVKAKEIKVEEVKAEEIKTEAPTETTAEEESVNDSKNYNKKKK